MRSMLARFRNGKQSPPAGRIPFPLELGKVFLEELALRGIVDQDDLLRLVQAYDYDIVQRCVCSGL